MVGILCLSLLWAPPVLADTGDCVTDVSVSSREAALGRLLERLAPRFQVNFQTPRYYLEGFRELAEAHFWATETSRRTIADFIAAGLRGRWSSFAIDAFRQNPHVTRAFDDR